MIEATLTLYNGNTIVIITPSWVELSARLEELPPIKKMVTRQIDASQMRQGKYSRDI